MGLRENKKEIRRYFTLNKSENTTYKNLCNAAKAVFGVKFLTQTPILMGKKEGLINYSASTLKNKNNNKKVEKMRAN